MPVSSHQYSQKPQCGSQQRCRKNQCAFIYTSLFCHSHTAVCFSYTNQSGACHYKNFNAAMGSIITCVSCAVLEAHVFLFGHTWHRQKCSMGKQTCFTLHSVNITGHKGLKAFFKYYASKTLNNMICQRFLMQQPASYALSNFEVTNADTTK